MFVSGNPGICCSTLKGCGAIFALLIALSSGHAKADPDEAAAASPKNRIDFSSIYFDSIDTDRFTGLLDYTRNLTPKSNLTLRASYLDSRFGLNGGTGLGDTTVTYSYLPSGQLSVKPWIPRVVGSGISVTLPTGDEKEGRGLGSTIITPFIGTAIPINDALAFTPTLAYSYSTNEIITGKDVRVALLDVGLTWAGTTRWWASFFLGYIKDFEVDKTSFGGRLSFGKALKSGWGFSGHLIELDSFRPGLLPPEAAGAEYIYELNMSYAF